jgi:MATE family, multidrug efflux pump
MDAQVRSIDAPISPNGSGVRTDVGSGPQDDPPAATAQRLDPRTRVLLEGPITSTLLRLATPNALVMLMQASVGLIETYFVGKLGTDALAGVALVFPAFMLMQMMSGGAMGGGISAAIARALGAGRRADADALAVHALAIGVGFGLLFMVAVLGGGPWLYSAMGGSGASLTAALTYSNVLFAGAILIWVFNSLASVIRGTGNMAVPAVVTFAGAAVLIPLSPCLIFGWGPIPPLGVAGGAVAVIAYYVVGNIALLAYLRARGSVVHLRFSGVRFRWPLFRDILRVGMVAALVTIQTNLTIAIATGFVGRFGPAAIAGYGTGSRLEYLLIPLVFGLGGPLVAMVGTNIGAGQRDRALRAAWIGAGIAAGLTEVIGLSAAAFPHVWLSLFDTDPAMLDAGSRYLHAVGPFYGLFGLGLALYFASQGAGRLLWPVLANLVRLAIAAGGGWLALRWSGDVSYVFAALGAALAAFGLITAGAVAAGAWFGPIVSPRPRVLAREGGQCT